MPLKYSAFTVMMPEFTPSEAVSLLKALGYDGVEWRVHSVPTEFPAKPDFWRSNRATIDINNITEQAKSIRRMTEDAGLEIIGLGTYLSYKLLDDVEQCMKAAKIMGAPSIRVTPPGYDGSENYNDLYEEAVEGYAQLENLAREHRVRVNIEIHHGRICPSASLAYRLVSNFDPDFIGVILDPGNMVFEGYENWQLGLELLGPYLSYVHVKNAAWMPEKTTEDEKRWRPTVVPLTEGFVSWAEVLAALDRVGYNGWISIEDIAPGDTRAKLTNDLAYFKALEARLGI
ncbi:MAG: sugar phosphate isomerase/epimerase [Armatimonadetes bacterium]|nr:sugar phosphate isomerase/epimerase [Armatimonadota bacterium]